MTEKEIKIEMMNQMVADMDSCYLEHIGTDGDANVTGLDDGIRSICDKLIRAGWRKLNEMERLTKQCPVCLNWNNPGAHTCRKHELVKCNEKLKSDLKKATDALNELIHE
mgnify:CR=1 FL=1